MVFKQIHTSPNHSGRVIKLMVNDKCIMTKLPDDSIKMEFERKNKNHNKDGRNNIPFKGKHSPPSLKSGLINVMVSKRCYIMKLAVDNVTQNAKN